MPEKNKKEDSLRVRYTFKLLTNLLGIPLGIITESIIPRALGAALYGSFSFLTNFFVNVVGFFDLGTSYAFYTKLSKRPDEETLKRFYWNFISVVSLFIMALFSLIIVSGFQGIIWPAQTLRHIIMGLFFAYLYWYSQIILKIVDAYALTKGGEIIRMLQKVLRLLLVLVLFLFHWLSLDLFFVLNYVIMLFSIIGWIMILRRAGIHVYPRHKISRDGVIAYIKEFYKYSSPLVFYGFIGMLTEMFDRWFLQSSAGSIKQGYYGLAYQIGTICFIFTSAMTPLIYREFAVSVAKNDFDSIRRLFSRYVPMLYAIAAYFGIFLSFQARNVCSLVGGPQFKDAFWSITIMSLYPIHQTYGQMCSSLFYATDKTKLYRNIGSIVMVAGVPVSYLLISGNSFLGLNLGDIGLSIKMVGIQFIGVNISLWYNTKFMNVSFMKYFKHQIITLILIGTLAYLSTSLVRLFISKPIFNFILSGSIYTLLVLLLTYLFPSLFSITRAEINHYAGQVKNRILTKRNEIN